MNVARISAFAVLLIAGIVLLSGCGAESEEDAVSTPQVESDQPDQAATSPEPYPAELSAAHILIMHKDTGQSPPEITRTKEEALALTKDLAQKIRDEGADFATLAKEYSDCPSGARGGSLSNFSPDDMVPEFSQAALKLGVGDVSDPVESPFGYHVILRQELRPTAGAKHILVQYKGSDGAPPTLARTKEEALTRIHECQIKLAEGQKFEDLAGEYSDCASAARGGDLSVFPMDKMDPLFDKATFACEVGKTTDVVETPFGYHIILRYK